MRISKVSSLKKNRIRSSYVDRNTSVKNTNKVESISPIKRVQNTSYYSSENHLMSFDAYYDTLKELKKEYKKFYHDQQQLEKAIENFNDHKDELVENMKELIDKYNNAIISLASFDKVFETNNIDTIINLLKKYQRQLNNLGIDIIRDKELKMNENIFVEKIKTSENALDFLFEPTKGLILRLYYNFKNIKVHQKNSLDNGYEDIDYSGILIDSKS